ncbi:hypothetical protein [Ilumatobacter sp.]|uniref:hypothetical protein n=1 Tax=Ilumatobacter sp. TaxID=1967498 RepID=UPI0037533E6F
MSVATNDLAALRADFAECADLSDRILHELAGAWRFTVGADNLIEGDRELITEWARVNWPARHKLFEDFNRWTRESAESLAAAERQQ